MLTFTDDYTRKAWIYLTKSRTELYERFREQQTEVERQSVEVLIAIRYDNAGEYQVLATDLSKRIGIAIEPTTVYTPEQNDTVERLNRTLITKVRLMLMGAKLPTELWARPRTQPAIYITERHVTTRNEL